MKNWFSSVVAFVALVVSLVLAVSFGNLLREVRHVADRVTGLEGTVPGNVALLEEKVAKLEEGLAKVDALSTSLVEAQKRLEALESLTQDVQKLRDDLKEAYGNIANLEKSVAATETLLEEMQNLREEFTGELARLEEVLQSDRKRLEALEKLSVDERFAALLQYVDKKLKELQERVQETETRWKEEVHAAFEKGAEEQSKRIAYLEKELETEKTRYEALEKEVTALREYVDRSIESQMVRLREEMLSLLEEKVQALQKVDAKLQAVEERIRTLSIDERFAALLKYLEERVKELRSVLEEVQARAVMAEDLEGALQTFEEKLRALEEEVRKSGEDLKKRLEELQKERMVLLEEKLGELSNSLASFETIFQKAQENLEGVAAQLRVLEEKFLSLEKNVGAWKEDVFQSLRKEVEALPTSQDLETIRKDLDALFAEREELRLKLQIALAEYERIAKDLEGKGKDIALLREEVQKATGPELESLRKQLEAFVSAQKSLEETLGKTEQEIRVLQETLQAKDREMETMLRGVAQNVQALSERLEAFGKRLEELGVLAPLKESFGVLEARLAEIERFTKEVLKKDLETKMQSLEETVAALRAEVKRVATESQLSSSNWQSVLKLLEGLEKSKASLEQRIQELYGLIEGREKKEEVEKDVQSLLREKEALRLEIAGLAKERMSLEGELEKRKRELADIEKSLAQLRAEKGSAERIRELEEAREKAEKEIQELQEALEAKDTQIADLQRKNEELSLRLEEAKKFTSYVILPWDSLWKIARRYYRDGRKWTVIWEANRDKIPDPQKLQPYVEIRIPRVPENTLTK